MLITGEDSLIAIKARLIQAIKDFSKAIELKPKFAEAYHNRGETHAIKGDSEFAIDDYNGAISLKPDFAEVYYSRGQAYFRQKRF